MTAGRLAHRAVVRVRPLDANEDAAAFLQGLLTNDVTGTLPAYAALLSAQGKALFDMIVWRDPSTGPGRAEDILLDCEAGVAEELVKRLSLYRLRRKLEITPEPELGVYWSSEPGEGFSADPRLPALGYRKIAAASIADSPVDDHYLTHRLSLGVAEGRAELGDILWLETNAGDLNGVSFTKGCYIGQENTARMNWRGKVNRRLLVVPMEASQPDRRKASYPELGLAVDHLRIADIAEEFRPEWMVLASGDAE
jgi:folate-binding protein YgfZ